MSTLIRSASKNSLFTRRESQDSLFPNHLKDELLNLKLPETKREVINEKVVQRKQELLEDMNQVSLQKQADKRIDIPNLRALLTTIQNIKTNKIILLSKIQTTKKELQEQSEQQNEIDYSDQILEEEEKSFTMKKMIDQLQNDIRFKRKECHNFQFQISMYDMKNPRVELKNFQNQQSYTIVKKQSNQMKQALSKEKEWQEEEINKMNLVEFQKSKLAKDSLDELCTQEDKLYQLNQTLENTYQEIQDIQNEITKKFTKIEECAEFLDELDDFDKITLLFVYETPDQFDLQDILEQAQYQLSQPKNRMQLAYSEQEYIDRARFSSVSSRMKIFFKFHNNQLQKSVDNLIQIYRKLQFHEMTLRTRHEDLLSEKQKLLKYLEELNALEFYTLDEVDEKYEEDNMSMDESNVEFALCLTHAQTRHVEQMRYFFVRIYTMLTGVLSRMMNALQNIKEVLKSCPQELFDEMFYLKWTYNKLFRQLAQVQSDLDKKYHIKIVAKEPAIRNSNQLLNAIYDHLEDRPNRKKTIINQQKELTLKNIFPQFTIQQREQIRLCISQDIFLQQFFKLEDLNNLVNSLDVNQYDEIEQQIQTEGYIIAHQHLRVQLKYLLSVVEEAIIDCGRMHEESSPAVHLTQKYNLHELIEKHGSTYEYKQKEWKKEVLNNRMEYIKMSNGMYPVNDFDKKQPSLPDLIQTPSTKQTNQSSRSTDQSKSSVQLKKSLSLNSVRRYVNAIDQLIPTTTSSQAQQIQQNPITIHLHHMNRRIQTEKSKMITLPDHTNFSQPIELSSKKSIDNYSQNGMGQSPLSNNLPILQKIVFRQSSKCPRLPIKSQSNSERSKQPTKHIYEQPQIVKVDPFITSTNQVSSVYGESNKVLKNFFKHAQFPTKQYK